MTRHLILGFLLITTSILTHGRASWAQAQPGIDLATEADLRFELGIQRYRTGDYRGALQHLLHSNRLGPNKNVIYNIARCFEQLRQYEEAFRYYSEFLALEENPRARRQVEARVAQLRPQLALLRIESEPPGATIFVDRRDLGARGMTPLTMAVEPGARRVTLDLEGYEPVTDADVRAVRGKTRTIRRELAPIVSEVEVEGDPPGAEIRLQAGGDEVLGRLPVTLALPTGPHVLVISAEGRETVERLVYVQPGEPQSVSVSLPELVGSLVVSCSDRGARVEVDGVIVARTTGGAVTVPSVPAGSHHLRVMLSGFETFEQDVTINASQPTEVDVVLTMRREVIAASRSPETLDQAPTSVTVISREEIRAFGYRTLAEAMMGVRGMYTNFDRTYHTIGFRGFSLPDTWGNRALVTLDGHTTNEDETGGFAAGYDQHLDLMNLERIEVVRGPASALYGTNALVGVVNMVSRGPDDLPRIYGLISGDSTDRMVGAGVGGGYRFKPGAGVWLSARGVYSQGRDLTLPHLVTDIFDGVSRGMDGRTAASTTAQAWLGDFALQFQYNWKDKLYPTAASETVPNDDRALHRDQRGFLELRWNPTFGRILTLTTRAYLDWYDTYTGYPYALADDGLWEENYESIWLGGEARIAVQLPFWDMRISAGSEARGHLRSNFYTTIEVGPGPLVRYKAPHQVVAAYLQVRGSPTSWFSFSLSGRYEFFNLPDYPVDNLHAVSPHGALIFRASQNDVIKIMGATAYRAPTPEEFFYHDHAESRIAADDLGPERIYSGEVEYTHRFSEELSLTAAAVYNIYDDLIGAVPSRGGPGVLQYQNTDENVHTIGGELEVHRVWRQGWMASASYAFQRTRYDGNPFRDDTGPGESTRLPNSPEHLIAAGGAVPIVPDLLTLASRLRIESPRYTLGPLTDPVTDWAVLWDIVLSGEISRAHLSYTFGVRNLLDWEYTYPVGPEVGMASIRQPGRTFFANLKALW